MIVETKKMPNGAIVHIDDSCTVSKEEVPAIHEKIRNILWPYVAKKYEEEQKEKEKSAVSG